MKTHIVRLIKHQLRHNISEHVKFYNTRNCLDLSMLRMSYNLTKRTTKTEKIEKSLKSIII